MRFTTLIAVVVMVVVRETGAQDRIELDIPQGRLSGLQETTLKGRPIYTFRKIPFAKPPVGDLRFKDPEPAEGWEGVRDASIDPPRCIQQSLESLMAPVKDIQGEEDCLYVNVFTPKVDLHAKLPVLVYIYGGGFIAGRADEYVPNVILERDVLLVTIQYRVGTLGFLSTEDSVISGNFGLKDQTLSLRWVQQNIGYFGGDPNKVAIFGISAGSASVHYQMFVPEAKGLFSRALIQSGTAALGGSGDGHRKVAHKLGAALKCPVDRGSEELLECLKKVPAFTLVETTAKTFSMPLVMLPRVDGTYLPDKPEVLMASGRFTKVPMISGLVANEGAYITNHIYSSDAMLQMVSSSISMAGMMFGMKGDPKQVESQIRQIFDHFVGGFKVNKENADLITQIISDMAFNVGQDVASLVHSRYHPVYAYHIQHRGQHSLGDVFNTEFSKRWMTHADDLLYLFEGARFKPLEREEDLALRDAMTALWANFADTGNPTPDDSLGFKWEPVQESAFRQLILKPKPFMEDDKRKERREFLLNLPHFQRLSNAMHGPPKDEL